MKTVCVSMSTCVCVFYLSEQDSFQISAPVNITGTNLIFTEVYWLLADFMPNTLNTQLLVNYISL